MSVPADPLERAYRVIASLKKEHRRRSLNGVYPNHWWTAEQRITALRRMVDNNLQRALRAEQAAFVAAGRAMDAEQRAWDAEQRLAQYEGKQP